MGMNFAPYEERIEIVDYEPPDLQKIKKKIFNESDQQWHEVIFIKIPHTHEIEEWCQKNYGKPQYLGKWFKVTTYIVLQDIVYTHWKLCE